MVATLVPIVGGVALASLTEASFNWYVIHVLFKTWMIVRVSFQVQICFHYGIFPYGDFQVLLTGQDS